MKKLLARRQQILTSLIMSMVLWMTCLAAFGPWLQAQTGGSWLGPNPTLGQREEVASGELPETLSRAGNIPCATMTFKTRPAIPPLQQVEATSACAVATPQGLTAPGGFTNVFKADAKLFNSGGGPVSFYPVPGGSGGIVLENTAQGQRLHYYSSGVLASRQEFNSHTQEQKVYLSGTPSWTLKDKTGKVLHVRPESISFSSNGQWMVVDSALLATLRVNLATGEVVPFSAPYVYHLGLSVMPHTAVSDDGKTVATASDSGDLKVTDLASCTNVPDIITGPVSCSSARHEGWLRSQIAGYHRVYQPRFLNDQLMSLHVSYNTSPTTRALAKFRLVPSGRELESQGYLALGDSFASGEGAYDYFPETDTAANSCHLSRQSYPYMIGQRLGLSSYNSVACSGAKIQDITTYVQKQTIPAPNNMGRLLPGYKKQLQYVRDQNPSIITVGIGGNDIGFMTKIRACLSIGTCYTSYEDRLEIIREINRQFPQLVELYGQLKKELRRDARLYVVGYPRIAKANGNCALNVRLDGQELILTNQLIDYLNKIIELSSSKAGVHYVDVTSAFDGHRLCETTSQDVAMNGITLGNDSPLFFGPIGNESFHPNRLGHQLYTQRIIDQTRSFTQTMPPPNNFAQPPDEKSGLEILNAPKTNRPVYETTSDEAIAPNVIIKDTATTVQVKSATHFLQPNASYRIELHSSPIALGTFMTDSAGNATTAVVIPTSVPAGWHTLHVISHNTVGVAVDVYKTVYIAEDADNFGENVNERVVTGSNGASMPHTTPSPAADTKQSTEQAVVSENTASSPSHRTLAQWLGRIAAPRLSTKRLIIALVFVASIALTVVLVITIRKE